MEINKIILGDSYKLIKKIPDKSIDLIITDPPYQIDTLRGGGIFKEKAAIKNIMDDLEGNELNIGIDLSILDDFIRVMKKPNIYIWMNLKQLYPYLAYFVGKHGCNWNLIVWQKSNAMPLCGGKYLNDCEYCAYFYKGVKLNTNYETAKTIYVMPTNSADKALYDHPTIKPEQIIEPLIINSSKDGDLVFDPFVGSGTTCAVAKRLARNFLGFEINEKYFNIAQDRIRGITQKERRARAQQLTLEL